MSMTLLAVDVLARLRLAARRHRLDLKLTAPPELCELIAFLGLDDALRVEPRRQAEQREQPLGVEEECELLDPPR